MTMTPNEFGYMMSTAYLLECLADDRKPGPVADLARKRAAWLTEYAEANLPRPS